MLHIKLSNSKGILLTHDFFQITLAFSTCVCERYIIKNDL